MAYLPPEAPPTAQKSAIGGVRAAQINLILALVPIIWWLGVILGYALLSKEIYVPYQLTGLWGFLIPPVAASALAAVIMGHVSFKKHLVPASQRAKTIFSIALGYATFLPFLLLLAAVISYAIS